MKNLFKILVVFTLLFIPVHALSYKIEKTFYFKVGPEWSVDGNNERKAAPFPFCRLQVGNNQKVLISIVINMEETNVVMLVYDTRWNISASYKTDFKVSVDAILKNKQITHEDIIVSVINPQMIFINIDNPQNFFSFIRDASKVTMNMSNVVGNRNNMVDFPLGGIDSGLLNLLQCIESYSDMVQNFVPGFNTQPVEKNLPKREERKL